ncbi:MULTISPECIES: aldo/keto reductase [unclassified Frondihabitans]|uniref:aldo/keto reductase n=1 Tax=unclassified Frondihabitans TaxID=2626248 RepID=UPI000F4E02F8|nr:MULTISPECIES: aldo/keto reductase [unclassified Frondihabitans]RPE77976.1 D-threo-aldose 1-dehydrogenase [Frondihabitans sp. PhB153]RPF08256.1 D-threo-aldose 1-dehydrogenase [Frondihabitans sp. PhB161]
MEQRIYGRTGFSVSPLCIGTSSWGRPKGEESQADADVRIAEIARSWAIGALRLGAVSQGGSTLNFLDTSNEYGEGRSEPLIGSALAASSAVVDGSVGNDLVVQTKLDRDVATGSFSTDRMRRSLEESLSRLGLERIQVMHLHDPETIGFDAAMAADGPVAALVAMKEEGLVSSIGISGGPVGMLQQFVETDLFDALITHNRYTLVDRSASDLFDAATARNMGITNAAPYGGGILTGDPRFAGSYGYQPATPEILRAVNGLQGVCDSYGIPLQTAALQFSIREPRIHSTVVGVSSLPRLESAIDDATAALPEALWAELDAVVPAGIALDA